jgi:hypothetical protein
MATQQQCEDGYHPLYDWCMSVTNNNHAKCLSTCDASGPTLYLLNFINTEINNINSPEHTQDIRNQINYYRRTNQNIKKFIDEKDDLANKRNLEILERKDKDTLEQIIGYSILLIIAICFGIFCIYYYFNFK